MAKKLANAFLMGGGVGIAGQFFITVLSGGLPDATLVVLISMLFVGLVGAFLIASGVYSKLSRFAKTGADIPVCGLMYGAANFRAEAEKNGIQAGKAFLQGFCRVMTVVAVGFGISFVLGLMVH